MLLHNSHLHIFSSLLLLLSTCSAQVNLEEVQVPSISDTFGSMGVVGRYEGISRYEYVGQQDQSSNNAYYDRVIAQVDKQFYTSLQTFDGSVYSSCSINDLLFLSGNFTSIGGNFSTPEGLVQYNLSSTSFSLLKDSSRVFGSDNTGSISTLYCDAVNNKVYIGGSFTYSNNTGVVIYNLNSQSWELPLFGGFPEGSKINAITAIDPDDENSNIVFGGRFNGLANYSLTSDISYDNSSLFNAQRISFHSATVRADGSRDDSDPRAVICSDGTDSSNWEMQDNRVGSWSAHWPFFFNPTVIRLSNIVGSDTGLRLFRLVSFPSTGIMNLTYIDPATNERKYCDAWCPLPLSSEQKHVDFSFVNVIGTNGLQIEVLDSYGNRGGLSGVELFQNDAFTFANNSYNEQSDCADKPQLASTYSSSSELLGQFEQSFVSASTYVSAGITDASQLGEYSVVFEPNITLSGNYTILLYTPGCLQDGTCPSRGGVEVVIEATSFGLRESTIIYETNNYDKYDMVYNGTLERISDSFKPRITVRPMLNQPVPYTFVADKLQTILVSIQKGLSVNTIFEYSPANFTNNEGLDRIGNTTINRIGSLVDKQSEIMAFSPVQKETKSFFVGGNITSDVLGYNLFKISKSQDSDGGAIKLLGSGLNNFVTSFIPVDDDTTLLTGNFTGLYDSGSSEETNLNYIAFADYNDGTLSPLGKGANGPVRNAIPFNLNGTEAFTFNGAFTEVRSDRKNYSLADDTLPVWIRNENAWLPESSFNSSFVQGRVTSSTQFNGTYFYTGFLNVFTSLTSGASYIDSKFNLSPMPFSFVANNNETNSNSTSESESTLKKRSLVSSGDGNSIYAGAFVNSSFSILGGHFQAQDQDGLIYKNLIMNNGDQVSGFPNNTIDDSSTFYTLHVSDNTLYAGGSISGTIQDSTISGLVFYDLDAQKYSAVQPPGISGGKNVVNSIAKRPNSEMLIVAGDFQYAGSLTCVSMCIYDLEESRWLNPTPGLGGEVTSMRFLGNDVVLLTGDLQLNNTSVYLATYDFKARVYTPYNDLSSGLSGPITSLVLNDRGMSSMFVAGLDRASGASQDTSYVAYWSDENGKWEVIASELGPGSLVTDLSLLQLESTHESSPILKDNEVIFISGKLQIEGFGRASSAMYDGHKLQPILLTTNKDGSTGTINSFFSQQTTLFGNPTPERYMKRGYVILISLAIAVGLTFLIMAIGLLIAYFRRRKEGYVPANSRVSEMDMAETVPPGELLEEMKHVPGGGPHGINSHQAIIGPEAADLGVYPNQQQNMTPMKMM